MGNGRIAFGQIAGQHHVRHQLQQRMQVIHVETHRSGESHGIATRTRALHVENALADFLLAEPVEGGRGHLFTARQHMCIPAREKHGVATCQGQPFTRGFLQFRMPHADEMEPRRLLFGKSRRPGGGHAAAAIFHTVKPKATQHFRQRIVHGISHIRTIG